MRIRFPRRSVRWCHSPQSRKSGAGEAAAGSELVSPLPAGGWGRRKPGTRFLSRKWGNGSVPRDIASVSRADGMGNFTQHGPYSAVYDHQRRSVYLMTQRIQRHPFLALFDGADPNSSTRIAATTVPPRRSTF